MDFRHSILLLLVGATVVCAQNKTTAAPTTTAPQNGTTAAPTTTAPQNKTTAAPTTTAPQNKTTPAPTTTAPQNKTTAAPTTTAATSSPPPPTMFVVNNSDGNACIMENMDAKFTINYTKIDNTTGQIQFDLPHDSIVNATESMCSSNITNATIVLEFGLPSKGNKFVQFFNTVGNNTFLQSISLSLQHTSVTFPNSTQHGKLVNYTGMLPEAFMVQDGFAFACDSSELFRVDDKANVIFSNVEVQTSGIANNTFSEAKRCPQDTSSTPIATTTPMVTTPPPTPPPIPAADWTVNNTQGKVCMLVNMTMEFQISYNMTNGKNGTAKITLPGDADSSSSACMGNSANFTLKFHEGWKLEMYFMKYSDDTYNNTQMSLFYIYDNTSFPNTTDSGNMTVVTSDTGIKASLGSYFSCKASPLVTANNVTFNMTNVAIQPFVANTTTKEMFGKAADCNPGYNNIVPIAVGCALAGLVIIVLIAYLIGRQRSSKSGYESV